MEKQYSQEYAAQIDEIKALAATGGCDSYTLQQLVNALTYLQTTASAMQKSIADMLLEMGRTMHGVH